MSSFRFDDSDLNYGLDAFSDRALSAIEMYAETVAKDFESYAKSNRPWHDRTGNARMRLNGYVTKNDVRYRINLAHGVDYGLWLEMAREKRYAILEPTVRLKGPEALSGMEHLLDKLR